MPRFVAPGAGVLPSGHVLSGAMSPNSCSSTPRAPFSWTGEPLDAGSALMAYNRRVLNSLPACVLVDRGASAAFFNHIMRNLKKEWDSPDLSNPSSYIVQFSLSLNSAQERTNLRVECVVNCASRNCLGRRGWCSAPNRKVWHRRNWVSNFRRRQR